MSVSVEIKKITPLHSSTSTTTTTTTVVPPPPATVTVTVNQENLEDEFWAEVRGSKEGLDEDEHNKGNVTDEGEIEADWLSDVGLGEWTQQWRQGKSLPENDIGPAVQKLSLKPHQADAVRKRVRTLNATLKRKKNHRRTPDVRSFFQTELQENKDSSRSATPDSLDSNEFHSDSPPRRGSSPRSHNHQASGSSADELEEVSNQVPNFVSIFSNDGNNQTASTSPPNRNKDLFKPKFPARGGTAIADGEIATDSISGIEILGYHNVGTIYMKGYIPSKKPSFSLQGLAPPGNYIPLSTPASDNNARNFNTFTATKPGFTAELNRVNGAPEGADLNDESLCPEESYMDPVGLTRLCDLSEEDCKSIRPLILMELTAQCDHYQIQIRRKKLKLQKKNAGIVGDEGNSSIFGIPLDTLLMKDRQSTGDNNLEVPIIFDKLITHLQKRSMSEQGILRMAGQKAKINELRTTFETSLYSEPEQVDAAMSACSSHDVANLLKQFLREIPNPLLGYEYIDAFFEITDKLKDRSLETCLRLLLLLLPHSHQAVLRQLLQFLRDLVKNSDKNKMGLKNVALIVAPNLVPTSALGSQNKELSRAATWVRMTQMLIKYGAGLFYIPSDLLSQLRQINDRARAKRAKQAQNRNGGNGSNKALANGNNGSLSSKSGPCNYLKVSAPQLGFPDVMLPINAGTTAGEIVLSLLEEADRKAESLEKEGLQNGSNNGCSAINQGNANGVVRRRPVPRSQDATNKVPNLSCLLTQMNPDIALKTHSLYEIGGNIGYRRIDPSALLPAICRDNPSASWVLRCNHRHSSNL